MSGVSEGETHVAAMRLVCQSLEDHERQGIEIQWDVLQQMLDHMDTILQGITDQRNDDAEEIQILKKERDAAYEKLSTVRDEVAAEIDTLRTQLRKAAGSVDLTEGGNRNLRAEIKTLKTQLDDARVATINAQGLLDAARAETIDVRKRLAEEINRHNATHCEKIELFQQKESANQYAAELVRERDAALAAVSLQQAEIERLNTCLGKIRQHVAEMDQQEDLLCVLVDIRSALAELDAGTSEPEGGK